MAAIGLGRYTLLSFLAAAVVIYHAFATREYFYPATVYLSTSKIAVAVLGNLLFATAMCAHKMLIKVFFGSLRDLEVEMIRERLSSAVMESLLALTIFREEFGAFFVAMFATLVFVKVMHWLVQDRVDYVEVTPSVSFLQHLRLVSFMSTLLLVDILFLQYTIHGTIQSSGQSVMLLFAFEYVIQASNVIRYSLKYIMSVVDMSLEGRWESKSIYVFYLELVTDLLHLFVYCVFFLLVYSNYGLPLHLVRDLYSTFRNFRNRIVDFLRFRAVTARLDRFPDATAEDLQRSDGVCIICREEMSASGANKKLGCSHVFHLHCLRSWLERQQNCPTCRASVFRRVEPAAAAQPAAAPQAVPAAVAAAAGAPDQGAPAAAAADAVPAPPVPPAAVPGPAVAGAQQQPQPQPRAQARQPLHHFHVPNLQHPRVRLAAQALANRGQPAQPAQPGQPPQQQQPQQQQQQQQGQATSSSGVGAGTFTPMGFTPMMPPGYQLPPGFSMPMHPPPLGAGFMMPQQWIPYPLVPPGMPLPGQEGEVPPSSFLMPPLLPGMAPMGTGLESQVAALAASAAWAATAAVQAPHPGFVVMGPAPPMPAPAQQGASASAVGSQTTAGLAQLEAAQQVLQQQLDRLQEQIARLRQSPSAEAAPAPAASGVGQAGSAASSQTANGAGSNPTAAAAFVASTPGGAAAAPDAAASEATSAAPAVDTNDIIASPSTAQAAPSPDAPAASASSPGGGGGEQALVAPADLASAGPGRSSVPEMSGTVPEDEQVSDEQAEIRRRRLQRFEQAGQQ